MTTGWKILVVGLAAGAALTSWQVRDALTPASSPVAAAPVPAPVKLAPRKRVRHIQYAITGPDRNKLSADVAHKMELAERSPYWVSAQGVLREKVVKLVDQHAGELRRGLRHDILMHGDLTKKEIALTFDDGPHPGFTQRLLDVLRKYNVPATFFVVGQMAERNPDLVRKEVEEGHVVANHTYHHVSLKKIPEEYQAIEIKACGEVLESITGKSPNLFRPPGGRYNDHIAEVARALGYKIVLWTDDPGDYDNPGQDKILHDTLYDADNGGIILLHDGVEETIQVLPKIITTLRQRGYKFVTIDEMAGKKRPVVQQVEKLGAKSGA
jgi:peptidoglycan/xylan/chitin deacetylase (PgdA/CDA1 family)